MNKNIVRTIGVMTLTLHAFAFADVVNGDFESWSNGVPNSWDTIDSGIEVSQSNSIVYNGDSAAAITVNTTTQGSTDFRQSVDVVSGESYTFSVWVYHTEGGVSARLYVDGYQGYSTPSNTGQWQELSYAYTASSTSSIDIGLRFYDQSSFDGSELVYVDLFSPTDSTSEEPGGETCESNSGSFSLVTDNYGSETSWTITNSANAVEYQGSGYESNTTYSESVCLTDDTYTLTIQDSYGDGICCSFGSGSYSLTFDNVTVASGGEFTSSEATTFTLGNSGDNGGGDGSGGNNDTSDYYSNASGMTGYSLKTALYNIIKGHSSQSYGDLWTFYVSYGLDSYYENDGSILDIYSELPSSNDPYSFTSSSDQCGNYSGEGDCYNREHSFPRSWFGGAVAPMNTDIHHVFPTDGYVNSKRSSYPYGEVGSSTFTSQNGSLLGAAVSGLGYSGTVFEPIDEFKGDIARAYFYMATRYEDVISSWESNSSYGDAVLNGTSSQVFESWFLTMLLNWHQQDPVSQKEIDRNEAAYSFQSNRNPFIDNPGYVNDIWGN
ncbi:Endonuclease I [Alteromonas sp. 38]|uniref:endonuclease n=1 Tax=unclassified Alteromonas TaxID=2614992 RepID=UPI0012F43B89|nr:MULTISPECIES: endonuclease [unclassified Alteromonas]CAD5246300.1 Endonuclease I [Alteromonas sp. 154]VXC57461.1 Endonuclease I [Alteromonas sp. 38]